MPRDSEKPKIQSVLCMRESLECVRPRSKREKVRLP
nr:MAG TPA: hypothetical protein [Caudoviricetes sp.]